MTLKEFLDIKGKNAELRSHNERPNHKYSPTLSSVNAMYSKLHWVIDLLNDIYDVEERDGGVWLKTKDKSLPE